MSRVGAVTYGWSPDHAQFTAHRQMVTDICDGLTRVEPDIVALGPDDHLSRAVTSLHVRNPKLSGEEKLPDELRFDDGLERDVVKRALWALAEPDWPPSFRERLQARRARRWLGQIAKVRQLG